MHGNTRKKLRLPDDRLYTHNNSFFVTICVRDRKCIFGDVGLHNGNGEHSPTGEIVKGEWLGLPNIFENIVMEDFVIMPNHFHGIITFYDTPIYTLNGKETNLSDIISKFKSLSWYKINKQFVAEPLRFHKEYVLLMENKIKIGGYKFRNIGNLNLGNGEHSPTLTFPSFWQKSFYDHVVRDEKDLFRVREYIFNNAANWKIDELR